MARHWSSLASVELKHREGFVLVAAAARSRSRKVSATEVTMTAANRSKAVHASQSATSSKVGGGAGGLNGGDCGVYRRWRWRCERWVRRSRRSRFIVVVHDHYGIAGGLRAAARKRAPVRLMAEKTRRCDANTRCQLPYSDKFEEFIMKKPLVERAAQIQEHDPGQQ